MVNTASPQQRHSQPATKGPASAKPMRSQVRANAQPKLSQGTARHKPEPSQGPAIQPKPSQGPARAPSQGSRVQPSHGPASPRAYACMAKPIQTQANTFSKFAGWRGKAWLGLAWLDDLAWLRLGLAWLGLAWLGIGLAMAGLAWLGLIGADMLAWLPSQQL